MIKSTAVAVIVGVVITLYMTTDVKTSVDILQPTTVTVNIACTELAVTGTFNKGDFPGGNITKITWNDPLCEGHEETDTEVSSTTTFTRCQSIVTQTDEKILQENTAHIQVTYFKDIVQRDVIYDILLQCTMSRNVDTPLGTYYNVTEKRFLGKVNGTTAQANFDVRMDIYNANFTEVLVNPTVTSFDPIHLGIREANNNPLLKFIVQQCYATPSSSRQNVSYTFFYNKCPVDNSFERIDTTSLHRYHFKIAAFKFIRLSKSVYIHCRLAVCKTNATSDSCTQEATCDRRRRKREIVIEDAEKPVEEVTVMTSRLTLTRRNCEEITCTALAMCFPSSPPVCRCGGSYVLNQQTGKCSNDKTFIAKGLHLDMEFKHDYLDPYSNAFIELANVVEEGLQLLLDNLKNDDIAGMKVISARQGSVVVDVRILYKRSQELAHAKFLEATSYENILGVNMGLKIKSPAVWENEADQHLTLTVVLSVILPVAVLVIVGAALFYHREKFYQKKKVEA